jgi:hypothetical protein
MEVIAVPLIGTLLCLLGHLFSSVTEWFPSARVAGKQKHLRVPTHAAGEVLWENRPG